MGLQEHSYSSEGPGLLTLTEKEGVDDIELCGRFCGCDLNVRSEERRVLVVASFCSWVDGRGSPWEVRKWEAGLG